MSVFDFVLDSKVATCLFEIKKRPNLSIDDYSHYLKAFLPDGVSSRWITDTIDFMIECRLVRYTHSTKSISLTSEGFFISELLRKIRIECIYIEDKIEEEYKKMEEVD